jgi:hypothetical protein
MKVEISILTLSYSDVEPVKKSQINYHGIMNLTI